MRKLTLLLALIAAIFVGCTKSNSYNPAPENTDITSKIFRIVVQSDGKFTVTLTELHADKVTSDTLTLMYNSNSQFSYGYAPSAGSQLAVKVISPKATALSCIFLYQGLKVGPDAVTTTADGMQAALTYTVGK